MDETTFKNSNTVKTVLCISSLGLLAVLALGLRHASAVEKKVLPACAASVPAAFSYVSEAKGASHYKTADQGVVAISCLKGAAEDLETAYQDLPPEVVRLKLQGGGFYYEVSSAGVATRTYLMSSKESGKLLQVSWVYPEGQLPSEPSSRAQLTKIKGSDIK